MLPIFICTESLDPNFGSQRWRGINLQFCLTLTFPMRKPPKKDPKLPVVNFCGIVWYLPPIKGTRKLHWPKYRSWHDQAVWRSRQRCEHHQKQDLAMDNGSALGWVSNLRKSSDFCLVVVSNIFYFHRKNWGNDPIWRIFFNWVETTN